MTKDDMNSENDVQVTANSIEKEEIKSEKTNIDSEGIIPDEILEAIPEEERGKVVSIIKQSMFSGISRRSNPIADKITPDHITTLISNSDENDKRDRVERKSERNYNLILIVIGLLFIGFLIVYLQSNLSLLITIITAILSFIGGFGFGKSQKSSV
ncbi:YrzE family protein [Lutibacter sp. B1]|uniref:YrzE family protein n=1 Tax=Lutibacter sp. B1 TaxID=2725996 RepID=UPI00145757B7|nr:YrzE family protein [Lutibacter sp. B1]NLP59395.1 YrzE family protein [Lutibacter sp. B1]